MIVFGNICKLHRMFPLLHSILNTIIVLHSTELMSGAELMIGAKSRKRVHQKPTNQPSLNNTVRGPTCDRMVIFEFSTA